MPDNYRIFLSYNRTDQDAAVKFHDQLERCNGVSVFMDETDTGADDLWHNGLQEAVNDCDCFIVMVGGGGVGRRVGAETQAALNRHFGLPNGAEGLPIFPILLGDTVPEAIPAFLGPFQIMSWMIGICALSGCHVGSQR